MQKKTTTKRDRARIELNIPAAFTSLAPFNILPGDTLCLEVVFPRDKLRDGELLAINHKSMMEWSFGRYIPLDKPTASQKKYLTEYYPMETPGGGCTSYEKDTYVLLRVISITRTFKPDEPSATECSPEKEKQERLAALRARLESVNRDDEITSCTARFRLEKEIYDLERELGADEWPEVIGDE
jgi:hypothetical protein